MKDFEKKIVIVTGAARGIGAAIAQHFSSEGAVVAAVDTEEQALTDTVHKITELGGKALGYVGSVTERYFLDACVAELCKKYGGVDVLVNNAGIIRDNFLNKISEQDWDAVLSVNLKGPFLCCQAVIPKMRERQSGKIVNIISRSWLGNPGQTNYAASKGGLVSLTRTLALELARYKINVNAVSPGLIDTPMTQGLSDEVRARLLAMQPTKEMGTPDDIAYAVGFLASRRSHFITGQVLHVDGGKSCGILSL